MALPAVYAANDYSASQAFGRRSDQNSWGIAYDSVRHDAGERVGVFRLRRSAIVVKSDISVMSGMVIASVLFTKKLSLKELAG